MNKRNFLHRPDETLHRLTAVGGFQDVSEPGRSLRVLRHDVAGVTLYAETGSGESWPDKGVYIVAYESETAVHDEVQQVIIETDDPRSIWVLLELIEDHTIRIERAFQLRLAVGTSRVSGAHDVSSAAGLNAKAIARFEDDEMRASIEQSLARLSVSERHLEDAYDGFMNAVFSKVDDWLLSRSFARDAWPNEDP